MVHYLSAFRVRDLSALPQQCLRGSIFSVRGGDIDGPDKVSAKSEDESVQKSLRQMEAQEGDAERGGRAAPDTTTKAQKGFWTAASGRCPRGGLYSRNPRSWWRCTGIFTRNATWLTSTRLTPSVTEASVATAGLKEPFTTRGWEEDLGEGNLTASAGSGGSRLE